MHSSGGNKVVATLRADGKVYPTDESTGQLVNLINYKIKTEGELLNKSPNSFSQPTTVVDLGKQLLQYTMLCDVNGVKNTLSRGAPFASDWLGMSALHFAAMNNQLEICEILLHGGINKDSKTKVDRTPLHLACYYGHERIVALLLSKKCLINPRDMLRMTPLHWAVEKKHKNIVRLLLKHNADVTISSKFGKTPIALAVLYEQADLLAELEAARQTQINRKHNEDTEKETSEAVNSIMGLPNNIIDESGMRGNDEVGDSDMLTNSEYAAESLGDLESIKGANDNSTVNLLKSHGIAMMQDDDDTSKDLLNTALQNGRQLVLSEGGKMLLHETQRNLTKSTNLNNNNNNSMSPMRLKADAINQIPHANKLRSNVIAKSKDSPGICKNKNIRIISLTDFKKLCADTNIKTLQKIPPSLASTRVVRQLTDGNKFVNVRQLQSRQARQKSPIAHAVETIIEEDDNVIEISQSDLEAETRANAAAHMRAYPNKRVENVSSVQTMQVCQMPINNNSNNNNNTNNKFTTTTTSPNKGKLSQNCQMETTSSTTTSSVRNPTNVMPLLTPPEMCRQLYELRRQNEELRRKFELAQNEKEEFRQRLERLEELLLVEKSDVEYIES